MKRAPPPPYAPILPTVAAFVALGVTEAPLGAWVVATTLVAVAWVLWLALEILRQRDEVAEP